MALQLWRAKTDWSGCCQMTVQGALWLAKHLSLNLNFSFLNRISLLLISSSYPIVLMRLGGPVPDPILPDKFLWYSRESNPGPIGWQSYMLTTIPNRECVKQKWNYNMGKPIDFKEQGPSNEFWNPALWRLKQEVHPPATRWRDAHTIRRGRQSRIGWQWGHNTLETCPVNLKG